MYDKIDVFEVTFECTNEECGRITTETTTDLFTTLYQRCCGVCGCTIMRLKRCKHIFGNPIPMPEDMFEERPDEKPKNED